MIMLAQLPAQGPYTQLFGVRSVTGSIHGGLDIACVQGTPVEAPQDGEVVDFVNSWTVWNERPVQSYGIGVCIKHRSTDEILYSLCAHLSRADVSIGDHVVAGQQIGLSGSTGVSTGGHVHFQLSRTQAMPSGTAQNVDPLTRLEEPMTPQEKEEMAALRARRELAALAADLNKYTEVLDLYQYATSKGYLP
jgi:murein DD-endopeptidase MepM/ murein hydrolase activator NlpD